MQPEYLQRYTEKNTLADILRSMVSAPNDFITRSLPEDH